MHDAGARWNNFEIIKGCLTPTQKLVALGVALVLEFDIALKGVFTTSYVDDYRVVDHHFCRREWIDAFWVSAKGCHCFTHGCEVDDARNSSEVLHDYASWRELDFGVRLALWVPGRKSVDVLGSNICAVFGTQKVLEKHL